MKDHPLYGGKTETAWTKSADLLERSVAIAIMVKMDETRIDKIASALLDVSREVL
jgi:dTDP-4-amino-4,6-dideoxygalactose transaminase